MLSLFFFTAPAPSESYTLSLHDALPILLALFRASQNSPSLVVPSPAETYTSPSLRVGLSGTARSEEHTSELQSLTNLVCRLLLEKKKHKEKILKTARQQQTTSG